MHLMKWRPSQREVAEVSADASSGPLASNFVPRTHDQDETASTTHPPPADFDYTAPAAFTTRSPQPLIITKDIEALLEEDARKRHLQNESESGRSRSPFSDSSVDWSGNSPPLVGLPAPPRGPRKVIHRERTSRRKLRQDAALKKADSISSGELFTITTTPPNLVGTFADNVSERTPTAEAPNHFIMSHSSGRNTSAGSDSTLLATTQNLPSNDVDFGDGSGEEKRPRAHSADLGVSRPGLASTSANSGPDVPEDVASSVGNRSDIFGLHGTQLK